MILIPPAAVPCNVNVGLAALAGDAVADALVTMAASRLVSTTEPRIATSRRSFLSRTCMIVLPLCYLSFRPSDGSASIPRHAGEQGNSRHRRRCRLSPERLPAHRHGGQASAILPRAGAATDGIKLVAAKPADEGSPLAGTEDEDRSGLVLAVPESNISAGQLGKLDAVATGHAVGALPPAGRSIVSHASNAPSWKLGCARPGPGARTLDQLRAFDRCIAQRESCSRLMAQGNECGTRIMTKLAGQCQRSAQRRLPGSGMTRRSAGMTPGTDRCQSLPRSTSRPGDAPCTPHRAA